MQSIVQCEKKIKVNKLLRQKSKCSFRIFFPSSIKHRLADTEWFAVTAGALSAKIWNYVQTSECDWKKAIDQRLSSPIRCTLHVQRAPRVYSLSITLLSTQSHNIWGILRLNLASVTVCTHQIICNFGNVNCFWAEQNFQMNDLVVHRVKCLPFNEATSTNSSYIRHEINAHLYWPMINTFRMAFVPLNIQIRYPRYGCVCINFKRSRSQCIGVLLAAKPIEITAMITDFILYLYTHAHTMTIDRWHIACMFSLLQRKLN